MEGRSVSSPHLCEGQKEEPEVPTVGLDYCFMSPEENDEGTVPALIMYDNRGKAIMAWPVEEKGAIEMAVRSDGVWAAWKKWGTVVREYF